MKKDNTALPAVIKKNTILLMIAQALMSSSSQLIPSLAGIIVFRFTGSLVLVGLPLSIVGIASAVASYPSGHIADSRGRRPVLTAGLILGGAAAFLTFYAIVSGSFPLFIVALALAGIGQGATNQIRVAAIDMYPVHRKAEGLSYVLAGSILGTLVAPLIVNVTGSYAAANGLDSLTLPWLAVPVMATVAALFVILTRPDTLKIAKNLKEYYPEEGLDNGSKPPSEENRRVEVASLLRRSPIAIAITSLTLSGAAIMIMITSLLSVVLKRLDYDLTFITLSVAIHILGMFGLSIIWGKLADRYGRKIVLILGALLIGPGALIAATASTYWIITLGSFLIGLGWSAINISATSIIGDLTLPSVRGRLLGITDLIIGLFSVVTPIAAGWVAQMVGFPVLGVSGITLSASILIVGILLREKKPGVYAQ
ncbi:MAG: MFS transporter [Candidatus Bathyarchaeia archaeon]